MTAQVLEATPSKDASGNISWTLCNKVGNPQCKVVAGGYPAITLPATTGSTSFSITINDVNHTGVIFANDVTDPYADKDGNGAMWLQPGLNNCPQQAVFDDHSQIPKGVNRVNDTKITFVDMNAQHGAMTFTYRLNFTRNGQPVTPLDPIIDNGGCCVHRPGFLPTSTAAFAVDLAIAFLIGVVVALVVRRFVSR